MAKMVPAQIDDEVSSAEKRIFHLLKNDPDTSAWTVLHSLGLARRETGPFGEIDFVVIIPGEGILCLEVKGGRVSCENGAWWTMNRHGQSSKLNRSPFVQSRDSMFALRNMIRGHFGGIAPESDCPVGCAVVFPDVPCPPVTSEFERTDVIDSDDMRGPISHAVLRTARARLEEFQPGRGERYPTQTQVKSILNYLRPDFDRVVAKSISLGRTESRLMSLTEEQYDRLDELEANPRCLFEGAAGTGKTLLALEYARRAERSGARVLMVCFNRLLGEWLREQTRDTGIQAGTWHETLKGIITDSSARDEFLEQEREAFGRDDQATLFNEIYPFYAEFALEEFDNPFDVLVMDEAQDLFKKETIDLVNKAIRGGIAGGTWGIFGDFARQSLYVDSVQPHGFLSDYCEHFVRAKLNLNCRNTRKIAEETAVIGGFSTPPFKFGQETGVPVEHRYWTGQSSLVNALSRTIDRLARDGVSLGDVMVLSPRRLEHSALSAVKRIGDAPIVDCSRSLDIVENAVRFSTIHSFKGLESKAVIIVDINEIDEEGPQYLLYVGMSRARSLLILMIHESARKAVDARIKAGLEEGTRA